MNYLLEFLGTNVQGLHMVGCRIYVKQVDLLVSNHCEIPKTFYGLKMIFLLYKIFHILLHLMLIPMSNKLFLEIELYI